MFERLRSRAGSPARFWLGPVIADSSFVGGRASNVTLLAMLELCWSRRCPYTFMASAPPSLWPNQRATVGISTPLSMQRVAKRCLRSWCVKRRISSFWQARVMEPWHSLMRMTLSTCFTSGRDSRSLSRRRRISGRVVEVGGLTFLTHLPAQISQSSGLIRRTSSSCNPRPAHENGGDPLGVAGPGLCLDGWIDLQSLVVFGHQIPEI